MNLNGATKRFWLPGTVVLLSSAALLAIFQLAGFSPYFPHLWNARFDSNEVWLCHSLLIYVPWLCALPFLGGGVAYWSRRQGSGPGLRIATGLFPVIVFLSALLVFLPLALAMGTLPRANIYVRTFAGQVLSWVVIPGAALLLGIVPFLMGSSVTRRLPS